MRTRHLLPFCLLLPLAFAVVPGGTGCSDDAGSSVDIAGFSLSDAIVTLDPRVMPGGSLSVSVVAKNAGQTSWKPGEVTIALGAGQGFAAGSLALGAVAAPGQTGTFSGKLTAPAQLGRFFLSFGARYDGKSFGAAIPAPPTEVTCSDGVYCNGSERFVAGQCVAGLDPKDDKADCTTDTCDEATGSITHEPMAGCAKCISECIPDCAGKVCGGDGCGGKCGAGCAAAEACDGTGQCKSVNQPGTCSSPLELLPAGTPFLGVHKLSGDTTDGVNEAIPTCNSTSTAVEKVYTFTLTEKMGIEARASGYDTVLHIRKEDPATPENECTSNKPLVTVGCSDDAAPPGNYGSRVDAALEPGKYYLIVDGFDSAQLGPFDLQVKFAANGCVPHCDGVYCGTDDGCGGDCGICGPGLACSKNGVCKPDPCTPDCKDKQCGDDGCDGSCGTCAAGSLCVPASSTCQVFANCDHDKPVCDPPCGGGEFCGTDCGCHAANAAMPDLVIDVNRLANEILFDTVEASASSCAVIEKCVGGTGTRKVVRFSVEAKNQGQATVIVPSPPERPDLFTFSPCHGHYHFNGFASYALLDKEGKEILKGQKQAYCMEDTQQIAFGPNVACDKKYTCGDQGIQAGWSDLYGNALDCQWLDVTDVPPGEYFIQVQLNPARTFEEVSFDNNTAKVPVTIQ